MELVFRTDASFEIGTGHVMRCLTLADTLRERSANCSFVCRALPGHLLGLIRKRGYDARVLPLVKTGLSRSEAPGQPLPAHAAWLGADYLTDAQEMLDVLGDKYIDWLVVDHYALDARWERRLRNVCRRLMVIDDLADRQHDCDLLLDQNLGRATEDYAGLVPADCTIFAGPKYALLRPEFSVLRPYSLSRRASPKLNHLFVSMGGGDKDNVTGQVLEALRGCSLPPGCRITVVMGPTAPWVDQIRVSAASMPCPTEVLVNVRNMANLMADSDVGFGAAGTSALERCCLGLPTLTVVLADNQQEGARALEAAGAVILLGKGLSIADDLPSKFQLLLNQEVVKRMQNSCGPITDGNGALRIAEELMNALH